jgi:hypothetical protein
MILCGNLAKLSSTANKRVTRISISRFFSKAVVFHLLKRKIQHFMAAILRDLIKKSRLSGTNNQV